MIVVAQVQWAYRGSMDIVTLNKLSKSSSASLGKAEHGRTVLVWWCYNDDVSDDGDYNDSDGDGTAAAAVADSDDDDDAGDDAGDDDDNNDDYDDALIFLQRDLCSIRAFKYKQYLFW